jgi:hypothetical protein
LIHFGMVLQMAKISYGTCTILEKIRASYLSLEEGVSFLIFLLNTKYTQWRWSTIAATSVTRFSSLQS